MSGREIVLVDVEHESDMRTLFPLIVQLRPHLATESEFLARWRRQFEGGYRVLAFFENGRPQALAGYRIEESLVHGRFLYVDDLVTDREARGQGHGERLMTHVRRRAQELGCGKLLLDTPMTNVLGHRFYFRCGMLATALRFSIEA
jgi:ribosomal protein S18 acetylase RimI-like enzyme